MRSALYRGQLRHRRFTPRPHEFTYQLSMLYLDLAELDRVFQGRWFWSHQRFAPAWLRRRDFLGNANLSIDQAVRDRVAEETQHLPDGPIRMLTHLRYFGMGFNPVTFYYCFDRSDARIDTIVAEITNTPWNERHAYVLRNHDPIPTVENDPRRLRFRFQKAFHVSPFLPMQLDYDWRFSTPHRRLTVHMQNTRQDQKLFDATLNLTRCEITGLSLARTLFALPPMSVKVIGGIYWQALRLWLKRTPFFAHPKTKQIHDHAKRSLHIQ